MTQGLFFPVVATILLWGGMTFLPKVAVAQISPASALVYEVLGGMTVALAILCFLDWRPEFNLRGATISYCVGVCGFLGTLFYFYAVNKGPVSVIATLTAMYPIVAVVCGVAFLHEVLTIKQWIGIGMSLCGLLLLI